MKLLPNWRAVLLRAWSMRLIALTVLLSGLEAALPWLTSDWKPGLFSVLAAMAAAGAGAARLVVQAKLARSAGETKQ